MIFKINIQIFVSWNDFSHLSFAYFEGCNMNKRAIDISDIEKKYNSIQKNINYDDVRRRIKKVLNIITDKGNNKARVSQETIGKYLFPHLGANSSTQSTMSRFVNGNKNAKGDSCPDINALGKLSQLTGISLDWFLYGNSTENTTDSGIIKAHDLYRMLFIDLPRKYGAKMAVTKPIEPGNTPIPDNLCFVDDPQIKISLPISARREWETNTSGYTSSYWRIPFDTFHADLYELAVHVTATQSAIQSSWKPDDLAKVFYNGISSEIDKTENFDLVVIDGMLSPSPF